MGIWFAPGAVLNKEKIAPYAFRKDGSVLNDDSYTNGDFDIWTSEWYEVGKANQNGGWTKFYVDPVTNVSMVTICVPMYDHSGGFLGVVTADIDITVLQAKVEGVDVSFQGTTMLLEGDGSCLAGGADEVLGKGLDA